MLEKKKKCLFTAEPAENTERRKKHLSRLSVTLRACGGKRIQDFIQDENAVSAVIGFVLIIAILISASSIYFASQIPELTADYESLHSADAADDLSELKVLIDGIKGERFERTTNIKMSPGKVPILGMSPPGSNLDFEPESEKFEVIVPVGGGDGGSGNWTIPNSGFTDYYDTDNSNRVSVSDDEVKLSSPTTTNLILPDNTTMELSGDLSYPYIHYYGQVIIKNNSTLSVTNATGVLRIHASSITVDASSKIDVDGRGNPAGSGVKPGGSGSSYSKHMNDYAGGGGGAGYGGEGGDGGGDSGGSGGTNYGDEDTEFIQMGSGGGAGGEYGAATGGAGGAGGGGIWLDAEEITIEGTISANGADGGVGSDGIAGGGGGGSGGGILIRGKDVNIPDTATFSANGGDGGNGYADGDGGGGGGGGRIKIFYELDLGTVNPVWSVDRGERGIGNSNGGYGTSGNSYHEECPKAYVTSPTDVAYYSSGYFVSTVHNTGNDSVCYGEMTWDATLNSDLVMKVRTDWNESMAYATPWDDCPELESDDGENEIELPGVGSVSPAAHRYIQYRAELSTDDDTETPVLQQFKVNYSFPAQIPVLANATGSIKFRSNYLHYPNQEIVYEHGAVIKYQSEGGFMLQEPPIIIANESGIPAIKISLVDLTGANYSYSGSITTSVKNKFKSYELLADGLKYPDLSINISTEYPSVWGDWFNKTFAETTLTTPHDYNVSVNATAKTVAVELYGHEQGVELYLERTEVEVEI